MNPKDYLLSIDTSTPACSVALKTPNGIYAQLYQGEEKHTAVILPMIDALLAQAQCTPSHLQGIICGIGPGAFTGLRVGASVASALALAHELPIGCISSLLLLAKTANKTGRIRALLDARMGQVYGGCYHFQDDGRVLPLEAERLCDVASLSSLECADLIIAPVNWDGLDTLCAYPKAECAFELLPHIHWQDAYQPIELNYLRNEVTQ